MEGWGGVRCVMEGVCYRGWGGVEWGVSWRGVCHGGVGWVIYRATWL